MNLINSQSTQLEWLQSWENPNGLRRKILKSANELKRVQMSPKELQIVPFHLLKIPTQYPNDNARGSFKSNFDVALFLDTGLVAFSRLPFSTDSNFHALVFVFVSFIADIKVTNMKK